MLKPGRPFTDAYAVVSIFGRENLPALEKEAPPSATGDPWKGVIWFNDYLEIMKAASLFCNYSIDCILFEFLNCLQSGLSMLDMSDLRVSGKGLKDFLSLPFQRFIDLNVLTCDAIGDSSRSMLRRCVAVGFSILDLLGRSFAPSPNFSAVCCRLDIAFRFPGYPALRRGVASLPFFIERVYPAFVAESSKLY